MFELFSNQVTPDLLKGQQELSVDPTEDTAKQMLFTYLKDGYVTFHTELLQFNQCFNSASHEVVNIYILSDR